MISEYSAQVKTRRRKRSLCIEDSDCSMTPPSISIDPIKQQKLMAKIHKFLAERVADLPVPELLTPFEVRLVLSVCNFELTYRLCRHGVLHVKLKFVFRRNIKLKISSCILADISSAPSVSLVSFHFPICLPSSYLQLKLFRLRPNLPIPCWNSRSRSRRNCNNRPAYPHYSIRFHLPQSPPAF